MTTVLDTGTHDPPGHTAPYLSAAIIVAVLVTGYLMWRDRHGKQNSHGTEDTTSWHQ